MKNKLTRYIISIITSLFLICNFYISYSQHELCSIPQIYMPEYFNQFGYVHGRLAFSPANNEAFWVITTSHLEKRFVMKKLNDSTWLEPEHSFLNIDFKETSPCYSPDGNRVYYQSRYNKADDTNLKDIDIYYRQRLATGWSEPENVGFQINTTADEGRPWIGNDNTLWFTRNSESTKSDIFYSEFLNGNYTEPIKVGGEINTEYEESEPIISPDGSYLLFISNRPFGYSKMMNLYISFKQNDDSWGKVICLSKYLKIENIWFPSLTFDGKFLVFCGGYPTENGYTKSFYYKVATDFLLNLK